MSTVRLLLLLGMTLHVAAYASEAQRSLTGSVVAAAQDQAPEESDEDLPALFEDDVPFSHRSVSVRIVNIPSQHKPLPLPQQEAVCEEKGHGAVPSKVAGSSTHN